MKCADRFTEQRIEAVIGNSDRDPDRYASIIRVVDRFYGGFSQCELLEGGFHIIVQSFSLFRKSHAFAGPDEQLAIHSFLNVVDDTCDVGLAVGKCFGSFGNALVLRNKVEHFVIIVRYCQFGSLLLDISY